MTSCPVRTGPTPRTNMAPPGDDRRGCHCRCRDRQIAGNDNAFGFLAQIALSEPQTRWPRHRPQERATGAAGRDRILARTTRRPPRTPDRHEQYS